MRIVVGMLACLSVGAISLALADPSTPPDTAAAPANSQPGPATTAPQAANSPAAPAKPAVNPEEKRLLAEGYKAEMRNGVKVFCRREEELGTRLGGVKLCGTVAELRAAQNQQREEIEKMQRTSGMPTGR